MSSRVYLFFPPRGHEPPRPPSVTVSVHSSAINAIALHSLAMPNARMSLCTQSVHYFSFPPLKVSEHDSLWQSPAAHLDERPCPQKPSRSQRRHNALTPVLSQRHGCTRSSGKSSVVRYKNPAFVRIARNRSLAYVSDIKNTHLSEDH